MLKFIMYFMIGNAVCAAISVDIMLISDFIKWLKNRKKDENSLNRY